MKMRNRSALLGVKGAAVLALYPCCYSQRWFLRQGRMGMSQARLSLSAMRLNSPAAWLSRAQAGS